MLKSEVFNRDKGNAQSFAKPVAVLVYRETGRSGLLVSRISGRRLLFGTIPR
jgi:hypothetical protein